MNLFCEIYLVTLKMIRSLNNNPDEWDKYSFGKVRVAALNIARLRPHMEDLKLDPTLLKADIIHLCETWVSPEQEGEGVFELEGYTAYFVSVGNGRGIVTYTKGNFLHQQDVKEENFQITKFSEATTDSIHIYRCFIFLSRFEITHEVLHIFHREIFLSGLMEPACRTSMTTWSR